LPKISNTAEPNENKLSDRRRERALLFFRKILATVSAQATRRFFQIADRRATDSNTARALIGPCDSEVAGRAPEVSAKDGERHNRAAMSCRGLVAAPAARFYSSLDSMR
jgi:hypothetical protein